MFFLRVLSWMAVERVDLESEDPWMVFMRLG
jgi:hypothetical protein